MAISPARARFVLTAALGVTAACSSDTSPDGEAPQVDCTDATTLTEDDVNGGVTLPARTCYVVDGDIGLDDGLLTIEQGAMLLFGQDASFRVSGDGRLRVAGVTDEPVMFTGSEDQAGYWKGLQFVDSMGADNVLEYLVLENAGSDDWTGGGDSSAALYLDSEAGVELSSLTITGSGGYGLMVEDGADWSMADSHVMGNAKAAWLHPDEVGSLDASNHIGGNTVDRISVSFGNNDAVTSAQTWHAFASPYHLTTRTMVEAPLTLSPGVVVEGDQDVALIVQEEGRLAAAGESGDPVIFTGVEKQPGYWRGILVETRGADNHLDHAVIEYAGSSDWTGGDDAAAMLFLPEGSQMAVSNTTFRESGHYALIVHEDADISGFHDNAFEDNARVARVDPDQVGHIGPETVFTGNLEQGVRVTHSNTDAVVTDQTWAALDVPYILTKRTLVDAELTIEPGATLAFLEDASLWFRSGSRLVAQGTDADLIVFQGHDTNGAGFWQGLVFESTTDNVLSKADVLNAGADGGAAITLDGRLTLDDVFIDQSGGHGIYLFSDAQLTCSDVGFGYLADGDPFDGPGVGNCI